MHKTHGCGGTLFTSIAWHGTQFSVKKKHETWVEADWKHLDYYPQKAMRADNISNKYSMCVTSALTWKTFGADIKLAKAEDRVAEKMPAKIKGPHADVISITWELKSDSIKRNKIIITCGT